MRKIEIKESKHEYIFIIDETYVYDSMERFTVSLMRMMCTRLWRYPSLMHRRDEIKNTTRRIGRS